MKNISKGGGKWIFTAQKKSFKKKERTKPGLAINSYINSQKNPARAISATTRGSQPLVRDAIDQVLRKNVQKNAINQEKEKVLRKRVIDHAIDHGIDQERKQVFRSYFFSFINSHLRTFVCICFKVCLDVYDVYGLLEPLLSPRRLHLLKLIHKTRQYLAGMMTVGVVLFSKNVFKIRVKSDIW